MKVVSIPDGVTTINARTFEDCSSLQSLHIPDSVTTIENSAVNGCDSLRSILIPATVEVIQEDGVDLDDDVDEWGELYTFYDCTILKQRQTDHPTYQENTTTWSRQRFNNIPIHFACYDYGYNNASSSTTTLDNLSSLIRENKECLTDTDAMGMTPLHILCYNPHATAEMMQIMVEAEPSLLTHTDVTGCTPLQTYLICRNLLETNQPIPSFQDLLEKGVKGEDLVILSVLDKNNEIDLTSQDEDTGLSPFCSQVLGIE